MVSERVYDEYCPQCGAGRRGPMLTCVDCGFTFGKRKSSTQSASLPGMADDQEADGPLGSSLGSVILIISVPLLALIVAFAVDNALRGELISVIESTLRVELTEEERSLVSVSEVCADPLAGQDPFCVDHAIAGAMKPIAVATIVVFFVMTGLIAAARRLVERRPEQITRVFLPGLYVTQFAVVVLMLAVGFLGVATAYLVPAVFGQIVIPGLIGIIAIAVGVALMGVIVAVVRVRTRSEVPILGHDITKEDEPGFHALVADLANRVGTEPPDRIIYGIEPNFFVTEADVRSLDGVKPGRTLVVSAPLLRSISVDELRAVLAHEMAHFRGRDTELTLRFFPVYRAATSSLIAIYATTGDFTRIIVLPPLAVIARYLDAFGSVTGLISRDRELAADRRGAEATAEQEMASALVAIHRHARAWDQAVDGLASELRQGAESSERLSTRLQLAPQVDADERRDLERRSLRHPTDTHPPLSARLEALSTSLADVLARPAAEDSRRASELATNLDAVERSLTDALRRKVRQALGMTQLRPVETVTNSPANVPAWRTEPEPLSGHGYVRLYDGFRQEYVGPVFASREDARGLLRLASQRGKDLRMMKPKELGLLAAEALGVTPEAELPGDQVDPHRFSGKTLNRCEHCRKPASDELHGQLTIVPA